MKRRIRYKKAKIMFLIYVLVFGGIALYRNFRYRDYADISPNENTVKYEVKYLYGYDGDTAYFRFEDGSEKACRFLGVDAPEIDEEGYEEARSYTDRILRNASRIILEMDPQADEYDRYDRLLAWVWADEELVQIMLLREGTVKIRYLEDYYLYAGYLRQAAQ